MYLQVVISDQTSFRRRHKVWSAQTLLCNLRRCSPGCLSLQRTLWQLGLRACLQMLSRSACPQTSCKVQYAATKHDRSDAGRDRNISLQWMIEWPPRLLVELPTDHQGSQRGKCQATMLLPDTGWYSGCPQNAGAWTQHAPPPFLLLASRGCPDKDGYSVWEARTEQHAPPHGSSWA